MDERPVFISFSSKDRKVAETIVAAVEARGFRCWISSRDVHPGENYQVGIVRAINAARVLLLIFSSNANASDEIKKELAIASSRHMVIIPVRIEDVAPSEGYVYELATRQWIDLFADWESAMKRLTDQIGTVVQAKAPLDLPESATTVRPPPPPAPAKRRSFLGFGMGIVFTLAGLVALAVAGYIGYLVFIDEPAFVEKQQAQLDCSGPDRSKIVAACTYLIEDGADGNTFLLAAYYVNRGEIRLADGDNQAAIEDFTMAIRYSPGVGKFYWLRGKAWRAKGREDSADYDFRVARQLGFNDPP